MKWPALGVMVGLCAAFFLGGTGCSHESKPRSADAEMEILPSSAESRLQPLSTRPATRPATLPTVTIIEAGEKSTLVYTCRQSRCEVLAGAIDGLISPEGSIQPAPALNVLIVNDRADTIKSIERVVRELDRPVPQLLVEARVVEVGIDDDFEQEIRHLFTGSSPDSLVKKVDVNLSTPGATPSPDQGSLISLRTFSPGDLALDTFIRLLLTRTRTKILSSPNLLVSAGSEASIITGQEVPIQSATIISGSVNTTTQFKRVGIKLRVNLLQITDDSARLELNPEVSTVTGFTATGTQGITNPIVAIRNVTSTLSMKDGEILTVGGLLSTEDREIHKGIPVLMDVPLVGALFQSVRKQQQRTQLIFFLRVHILAEGAVDSMRVQKPDAGFRELDKLVNPTTIPVPSNIDTPITPEDAKRKRKFQ